MAENKSIDIPPARPSCNREFGILMEYLYRDESVKRVSLGGVRKPVGQGAKGRRRVRQNSKGGGGRVVEGIEVW